MHSPCIPSNGPFRVGCDVGDDCVSMSVHFRPFSEPQVWDPEGVVIIPDHYIFTADPRANRNVDILRDFVNQQASRGCARTCRSDVLMCAEHEVSIRLVLEGLLVSKIITPRLAGNVGELEVCGRHFLEAQTNLMLSTSALTCYDVSSSFTCHQSLRYPTSR